MQPENKLDHLFVCQKNKNKMTNVLYAFCKIYVISLFQLLLNNLLLYFISCAQCNEDNVI